MTGIRPVRVAIQSGVLSVCGMAAITALAGASTALAGDRGGDAIPGYTYGDRSLASSPIDVEELRLLEEVLLFTEEDVRHLRMSREVLRPHVDEILDVWYGFVASKPQLLQYFSHPGTGAPDPEYLARVRERFARWILDTAAAEYDQRWLDYQYEIGRRHHRVAKNRTDDADAAAHIHYRYVPALLYPVTATLKPFLAKGGHTEDEVEAMHQAWIKSVLLQVTLWSQPYMTEGDF